MWLLLSVSLTYTSFPVAALTLLPPLHSTASLNAAILAPVGPMIKLWSPPGHIHTTGPVMKLWIFHRSPDTNCLFVVHPVSAALFSTVCVDSRGEKKSYSNTISIIFSHLSGNGKGLSTGKDYTIYWPESIWSDWYEGNPVHKKKLKYDHLCKTRLF